MLSPPKYGHPRRVAIKRINRWGNWCFWAGSLIASTLLFAIAPEILTPWLREFFGLPPEVLQRTGEIPISIRFLFKTKSYPGSIAVGVAEGNLTLKGLPRSIYKEHIDPGNFAVNKGFCSWNKASEISVEQADRFCLQALQRQSVATENNLFDLGLNPAINKKAIAIGTDLWNQSGRAGPHFAKNFKIALLEKGLIGEKAYLWARVESFRNASGELDASGLFGICQREPYYQQQLASLIPFSEQWRWDCIALDQRRRIREMLKVLK